jgi:hypothetical protein
VLNGLEVAGRALDAEAEEVAKTSYVAAGDGSSDSAMSGDLSSPAQTVSPSANQANEPERMEIAAREIWS